MEPPLKWRLTRRILGRTVSGAAHRVLVNRALTGTNGSRVRLAAGFWLTREMSRGAERRAVHACQCA